MLVNDVESSLHCLALLLLQVLLFLVLLVLDTKLELRDLILDRFGFVRGFFRRLFLTGFFYGGKDHLLVSMDC